MNKKVKSSIVCICLLSVIGCNSSKIAKEKKFTSEEKMVLAFDQMNFEKAIPLAKKQFEKKNDSVSLRILRRAYAFQENSDSAIYFYDESKTRNFKVDESILAKAYLQSKLWDKAIESFGKTNNSAGIIYAEKRKNNLLNCTNSGGSVSVEYVFDATESIDPERKDIVFNWDFGNGIIKKGSSVPHTFTEIGDHEVTFSTYDPIIDEVFTPERNSETVPNPFIITIGKGFEIEITKVTSRMQGKTQFVGIKNPVKGKKYIWSMGDGTIYEGIEIKHIYFGHGSYTCKVYELDETNEVNNCDAQEFPIGPVTRFVNTLK